MSGILISSLWGGLFGAAIAIVLTAPRDFLVATFFCAFAGRLARDLLVGWGVSLNLSTMLAAAVIVLVATGILRRRQAPPVVLVCAVLPLGAAVAMFNTIFALIRLSATDADALNGASVAFTSNLGRVFVITLSIALGIGGGLAIVNLFRREGAVDG